ncbi:hypothetical protein K490DRAFT_52613 [Saccharata proteae CBS 121410]|uniref:Uncharacterized protein n=1 Tax=Saccharata proteae CBS 121410 TaxID=1314787 RepID=A0A9P4LZR6_9PEZI|nr:hypothetical protein K490DRAFT_52613 [Saccharata proteae CBS 121410]
MSVSRKCSGAGPRVGDGSRPDLYHSWREANQASLIVGWSLEEVHWVGEASLRIGHAVHILTPGRACGLAVAGGAVVWRLLASRLRNSIAFEHGCRTVARLPYYLKSWSVALIKNLKDNNLQDVLSGALVMPIHRAMELRRQAAKGIRLVMKSAEAKVVINMLGNKRDNELARSYLV